jgi:hypothetical protein
MVTSITINSKVTISRNSETPTLTTSGYLLIAIPSIFGSPYFCNSENEGESESQGDAGSNWREGK